MISLKSLLNEENYTATSKESGKLVVFKSKDKRDAAVKSGTHDKPDDSDKSNKDKAIPNMFAKDYDAPDANSDNKTDSSSDDQTEAADAVLTAINSIPGRSIVLLNRKNRNGKIIKDVEFGSDEITNELIQSTAKEYDIDLNDAIKFGLDTKTKDKYGRPTNLKKIILDLVLSNLKLKEYEPDGMTPSQYYYEFNLKQQKETAALINKVSKPKKETPPKAAASTAINSYSESEVKNTKDKLNKNPGFAAKRNNKTFTEKEISDFANKYKVDVNRILNNPQAFIEFSNISDEELDGQTAEEYLTDALSSTMYSATKKDRDGMSWLDDLKKVYPLKSKSLSDKDWQSAIDEELKNPTTVSGRILKFTKEQKELNKNWSDNANLTKKSQASWVTEQYKKNPKYVGIMLGWQKMISKEALGNIDEMLIASPPPPVKAEALYRGMAMTSADLKEFLGKFPEGSDVKLPIGSFSFNPTIATDFSDSTATDNMIVDKNAKQAVIIKIVNSKNEFNGFSMNSNIDNTEGKSKDTFENGFSDWASQQEVLMASNTKYKVLKTETTKVNGGRSFTTITMEEIGATNEIKLKELIDYKERDILKRHLQYPQKRLD